MSRSVEVATLCAALVLQGCAIQPPTSESRHAPSAAAEQRADAALAAPTVEDLENAATAVQGPPTPQPTDTARTWRWFGDRDPERPIEFDRTAIKPVLMVLAAVGLMLALGGGGSDGTVEGTAAPPECHPGPSANPGGPSCARLGLSLGR